MSELRLDYLSGEWVSISPSRSERPINFKKNKEGIDISETDCPFCLKNIHMAPIETYRTQNIRVVPNKYPILYNEAGYHEVIVDTLNHFEKLHNFSNEHIAELFLAIQNRISCFAQDNNIKYVQVLKNEGMEAGASIYHSHCQILAMPVIPQRQNIMLYNFKKYNLKKSSCYLCDIATRKLDDLIIYKTDNFIAYCPFASQFTYMINIMPISHISDLRQFNEDELLELGGIVKKVMTALKNTFPSLDYNICFQNSPLNQDVKDVKNTEDAECIKNNNWHFHMQIIPRIGMLAGFELSTNCYVNSKDPIIAASTLRKEVVLW